MDDPILFWNAISLEVHRRDFTVNGAGDSFGGGDLKPQQGGPTRTSRSLAMVHIAMYEAFVIAEPASGLARYGKLGGVTLPPAMPPVTVPATNPIDQRLLTAGAVAGAASDVLISQWSRQSGYVMEQLAAMAHVASGPFYDHGLKIGRAVAAQMILIRQDVLADGYYADRSNLPDDMSFGKKRGSHQRDPFQPKQERLGTKWAKVTPFCFMPANPANPHGGLIDPPPAFKTPRYNAAVKDVKTKGDAAGTTRELDETVAGIFWGYDGPRGLGVPPRLYNQVVLSFVKQQAEKGSNYSNSPAENARLFALVNAGMADAAIVAWSAKYVFDLWRPVVGIREHDTGFGNDDSQHEVNIDNPAAALTEYCDPTWAPLGRPGTNSPGDFTKTPDFPAYPSGHATFGAVAFRITALFFAQKEAARKGTTIDKEIGLVMNSKFYFVSDEFNGKNMDPEGDARVHHKRSFSLREAIIENALSRVYLGVHWRFDGLGAIAHPKLEGTIPVDPSPADPNIDELKLGGVPIGLELADMIFHDCFTSTSNLVASLTAKSPKTGKNKNA